MLATFLKGAKGAAAAPANIEYVGGYVLGFIGRTTDLTISLTSLTGGLASAPAAGDLVIVYFGTGSNSDRDLVVADYTEVVELYSNDSNDTNLVVAYKFMGGTPDTSFTLTGGTLSTADAGAVAVQVWRGVDAVTPFDVTETTATGINSVLCDPPAITPVTSGAVIVSGGAGAHARATQTYSSSNLTGFISAGANDIYDVTIGLGYHVWTSGSFDPAQFTFSNISSITDSWAAVTLALRPGPAAKVAQLSYHAFDSSTTNASSYTFSSVAIGTAASDRLVIVSVHAVTASSTIDITSVTVAGVSATQQVLGPNLNIRTAIYTALVPSGTTADIVVTTSITAGSMAVATYSLKDYNSATPEDTLSTEATPTATGSLTFGSNAAVVAATTAGTTASAVSWSSPLTENYDTAVESRARSGASASSLSAQTLSVSSTASPSAISIMVAAAWR